MTATDAQPLRRSTWLALAAIVLVAASVRFFQIADRNYWLDELWTIELSTGRGSAHLEVPFDQLISPAPSPPTDLSDPPSVSRVWTSVGAATHPPLHFVLLRIWETVFGNSEFSTRSLSAIASLIALLLLFDIGRNLHGERAALWACAIFAIAGPQVMYARETRNYAMLVALVLGAGAALIRIETRGATVRRLVALGACVLAAMLTHYFAAGPIAAMFVYAIVRLRGADRRRTLIAFGSAGVLWLVVWGPALIGHVRRFGGASDPTTEFLNRTEPFSAFLVSLGTLPVRLLADVVERHRPIVAPSIVLLIVPAFLLRRQRSLLFAWLWTCGSIGLVVAIDLARGTKQVDFIRYTLVAGPGLYPLIGATARMMRDWRGHAIPALAIGVCLIGLRSAVLQRVPDWATLGQLIDERTADGDVFVFASPGKPDWATGYLYLATSHYSQRRPSAIALAHVPVDASLVEQLARQPRVWLICADKSAPPESIVPGMRAASGWDATTSPAALWLLAPAPESK